MTEATSKFGSYGMGFGGVALLLVLVHFWAGPFAPTPSLEQTVAKTAVAIRDATVAALKGEQEAVVNKRQFDVDSLLRTMAAAFAGIAIILGIVAFTKHESLRAVGGAVVLGAGAIAFQFATFAIGVVVFVVLVVVVLNQIGFE